MASGTGQCRDEHGGRRRGRRRAERKNEKKRVREREGERERFRGVIHARVPDTPPYPRIFRTPRSPSLAYLPICLPLWLAFARAPFPLFPLSLPPSLALLATLSRRLRRLLSCSSSRAGTHPCTPREREGITTRRIGVEHGGVGHIWRPMTDLDNTPDEQRSLSMLNIRKIMSDLELGLHTGRSYEEVLEQRQDDEGYKTATTNEQARVEETVLKFYRSCKDTDPILLRPKHIQFLKKAITHLNETYECLDSSRPWLCFWILHSLAILGERLEDEEYSKIAGFLAKCQSPTGGFGGGPGQYPHLASTYAAVNTLCTIGTQEAYDVIDRKNLKRFLSSLRGEDGSFCMHENGEVDIRGAYCALAAAKLTNVYTPDMFKDTAEWIAKCQTWEGGFGGCPGMEAHGGYAYCALAALVMLGKTELCNLPELLRWIVNKQMRLEGGFQGRTNKLVDGCYSFWQGGTFPLISAILSTGKPCSTFDHWLFNQEALQEYILTCCQNPHGGLLDKPGKNRDIYHTCYVLSGLSIAQNSPIKSIIGMRPANKVEVIHPVYNVEYSAAKKAQEYFSTLPIPD